MKNTETQALIESAYGQYHEGQDHLNTWMSLDNNNISPSGLWANEAIKTRMIEGIPKMWGNNL